MNSFHIHGCSVYSIPQVVSRPYPKLYPDYASIVYNWTPQQNVGLTPNSGKKNMLYPKAICLFLVALMFTNRFWQVKCDP